jgi:hypothetical protein
VFERARRSAGATRWHLFNLCGVFDYGGEMRPTADVPIQLVCIRCARLARAMLSEDEQSQPHGRNILAAAERRVSDAFRDGRMSRFSRTRWGRA